MFSKSYFVHNDRISGLQVAEYEIDNFIAIDAQTGKTLSNSQDIKNAVQKVLVEESLSSTFSLEASRIVTDPNSSSILISTTTSANTAVVIRYDFRTKQTSTLWKKDFKDSSGPIFDNISLNNNGKFAIIRIRKGRDEFENIIMNLQTQKYLSVISPFSNPPSVGRLTLSESGTAILHTTSSYVEKVRIYENKIIKIATEDYNNQTAMDATEKSGVTFEGLILDKNSELNRFVIDVNNNQGNYHKTLDVNPYVLPKLILVEIIKNKIKKQPLDFGKKLTQLVTKAAKKGVIISVLGTHGAMTKNGNYFLLNLTFISKIIVGQAMAAKTIIEFEHNWVGLWNLYKNLLTMNKTSLDLNSRHDLEPADKIKAMYRYPKLWRRQFVTRVLEDGTVILARGVVHDISKMESNVIVKINVINPQLGIDKTLEFATGNVNLNTFDQDSTHVGIVKLVISEDGSRVFARMTGIGTKIFDIINSLPTHQ